MEEREWWGEGIWESGEEVTKRVGGVIDEEGRERRESGREGGTGEREREREREAEMETNVWRVSATSTTNYFC